MPYMYPDLNVARDLANAGAACIMPLGAPIGSNKGICTKEFIQILIDEIDLPIIVDAGIAVLHRHARLWKWVLPQSWANTAVATAGDVEIMAEAFKKAIEAGRMAYLSTRTHSDQRSQRIISSDRISARLIINDT